MIAKRLMNGALALRGFCHSTAARPRLSVTRLPRELLGTEYGGWWVCVQLLTNDSIVYSFGVGTDISFDLTLIDRFGVTVHGFDPTPRSMQWIETAAPPPPFRFHAIGLAAFDGVGFFAPPERLDHVSYTLVNPAKISGTARCDVRRLETIARDLGHNRIDLLKMDIEGEEYAVIEDICRGSLNISQLLVEFHGEQLWQRRRRIAVAARQLRRLNLVPFSISDTGREYSFVKADLQQRASHAE